jgi:hypothetical protein
VSQEENDLTIILFIVDEVSKAQGPDGFLTEFYQACWVIIRDDLVEGVTQSPLPLYSLNFGMIILLPKSKEVTHIQQYRPICRVNISFKIFTKVAINKISQIAKKVISPSQTTFLPGRNIMEGVIVLHETIHEMYRKNKMV